MRVNTVPNHSTALVTPTASLMLMVTAVGAVITASRLGDTKVIVGAVVSRTVTKKIAVAVFPAASVAEHVTLVIPSANVLPEAGAHVTGRVPLTRSFAVGGVQVVDAPEGPVASRILSAGMPLIVG